MPGMLQAWLPYPVPGGKEEKNKGFGSLRSVSMVRRVSLEVAEGGRGVGALGWPSPSSSCLSMTGNKSDLAELREVQPAEAQSLVEHYDILCAIETSAKDSSNVEEAFVRVASELIMRHGGPMFSEKSADLIQLDSRDVGESWGCGC